MTAFTFDFRCFEKMLFFAFWKLIMAFSFFPDWLNVTSPLFFFGFPGQFSSPEGIINRPTHILVSLFFIKKYDEMHALWFKCFYKSGVFPQGWSIGLLMYVSVSKCNGGFLFQTCLVCNAVTSFHWILKARASMLAIPIDCTDSSFKWNYSGHWFSLLCFAFSMLHCASPVRKNIPVLNTWAVCIAFQ